MEVSKIAAVDAGLMLGPALLFRQFLGRCTALTSWEQQDQRGCEARHGDGGDTVRHAYLPVLKSGASTCVSVEQQAVALGRVHDLALEDHDDFRQNGTSIGTR